MKIAVIKESRQFEERVSCTPEVAKKLPLDRLLVETDSPFLSPVPFRGKTNEPGRTRYVAEKLSEIFKNSISFWGIVFKLFRFKAYIATN